MTSPLETVAQKASAAIGDAWAPASPSVGGEVRRRGMVQRFPGFLRRHPILLLFFLTPGIPEYLSGSSPLAGLVVAPGVFFLFLAFNAALYTPGVLLIREAVVRWRKGWLTVLVLGLAYGLLEEGVALGTLYNPRAGVVGVLGSFGHWMGVNWVWASGVLLVHVVFSVSVPILLLGLAVPESRDRRLLSRRGCGLAFLVLGGDVSFLVALTAGGAHFWIGWATLLATLALIAVLVAFAYGLPSEWERPSRAALPRRWTALVVGASLFPAILLSQALGGAAGLPAAMVVALVVTVEFVYFYWTWSRLRSPGDPGVRVAFVLGLLLPLALMGLLIGVPIEVDVVAVLLFAAFFRTLFRRYPGPLSRRPTVPTAARTIGT